VGRAKCHTLPHQPQTQRKKPRGRLRRLLKAGTVVEVDFKHLRFSRGTVRGPIEHITNCGGNCTRRDNGHYDYSIGVSAVISGEHLKWVRKADAAEENGDDILDGDWLDNFMQMSKYSDDLIKGWASRTFPENEKDYILHLAEKAAREWISIADELRAAKRETKPEPCQDGSPAAMRKALLAWFREHMPDTPEIRVKVSHRKNGPHVDISWGHCEGQCRLMLTAPVVERAINECGRPDTDYDYNYRMRRPRARIIEMSDEMRIETPRNIFASRDD
jgi:hypothetical protein